jgi:hypothetical protein
MIATRFIIIALCLSFFCASTVAKKKEKEIIYEQPQAVEQSVQDRGLLESPKITHP